MINEYLNQFGLLPVLLICLGVTYYFARQQKKKEPTNESRRTYKILIYICGYIVFVSALYIIFGRDWF